MPTSTIRTVKLGGSLLDVSDLSQRFTRLVATWRNQHLLLIVGGGRAADLVRRCAATFELDQNTGHWLAVRAMQLNTYIAAAVLRRCRIVSREDECHGVWQSGDIALVDPLTWLENEQAQGVTIAHRWTFTSDSISAHIAVRIGADTLTLLKSALPDDANGASVVDEDFQSASANLAAIELINLRTDPPQYMTFR